MSKKQQYLIEKQRREIQSLKQKIKNKQSKKKKTKSKVLTPERLLETQEKNKLRKDERELRQKQRVKDAQAYKELKMEELQANLKKNSTQAEKIFKAKLKAVGINYVFQHIIETNKSFYIVDFFIPKKGLVIEIDGDYHQEEGQKIKDKRRTIWLKKNGYKVIRFTNSSAENESVEFFKEIIEGFKNVQN